MAKLTAAELAILVDRYDEIKQERLEHDRASKSLKEQETSLKQAIVDHLREDELTAAGGQRLQVSLVRKDVPRVDDWDKTYDYILQHRAFDLLTKHINAKAIKDRIEQEGNIPGIHQEWIWDLSESRAKLRKAGVDK